MWRFPWTVLIAGLRTVLVIVTMPRRTRPGFVRFEYEPMSDLGVALLTCVVTSTPGTCAVGLDRRRRELQVHLLDASHPEAVIASIRHDFERPLRVLFGRGARV
jgi:multicomponent K+:H+ antiporter subunit E